MLLLLACAWIPPEGASSGDDSGCASGPVFVDADGDGYGAGDPLESCVVGEGQSATAGDCDDGDSEVHPGAAEVDNGKDDDCDEQSRVHRTGATVADLTLVQGGDFGRVEGGDFDGDGMGDLVVAQEKDGSILLYRGRFDGLRVSPDLTLSGSSALSGAGLADLDGDGVMGLVVSERDAYSTWLIDPVDDNPTLSDGFKLGIVASGAAYGENHLVGGPGVCGDTDGDGLTNVIMLDEPAAGVWLVDGVDASGVAADFGEHLVGATYPTGLDCASDLDGDGRADVILGESGANDSDGIVRVMVQVKEGMSITGGAWATYNPPPGSGAQLGRAVSGCGEADMLAATSLSGDATTWLLAAESGNHLLGDAALWSNEGAEGAYGVRCIDVDRDGAVDVFTEGAAGDSIFVWSADGSPETLLVDDGGAGGVGSRIVGIDEDYPLGLLLSSWDSASIGWVALLKD